MNKSIYFNNIQLKLELDKCLSCATKPCQKACPVKCDAHQFIKLAKENKLKEAVDIIYQKNPFGHICGLVCPEKFCMKACLRAKIDQAVNIKKIQATLAQKSPLKEHHFSPIYRSEKIAIVGAGPAGITAAFTLAKNGFQVTLIEKEDEISGALSLIPNNRLPKEVIKEELNLITKKEPFKILTNTLIKNPKNLLNEGFDYVFMATGETKLKKLHIKGENHALSYPLFLKNISNYKAFKKIAIIGGGNVAFDGAISAKKAGIQEVHLFVRRRHIDMRITLQEHQELIQNQITLHPLTSPIQIKKQKDKFNLLVQNNTIIDEKPVAIEKAIYTQQGFDAIISAIGSTAEATLKSDRIFYIGDIKLGSSSVVEAIAHAQQTTLNFMQSLLK